LSVFATLEGVAPKIPLPPARRGHLTLFKQVFYTYVSQHLWLND
jgi:hypothetical protein